MFGSDGLREKLIIFTEHRDTLRYLTEDPFIACNDEAVMASTEDSCVMRTKDTKLLRRTRCRILIAMMRR